MDGCKLYRNETPVGSIRWQRSEHTVTIWASCSFERNYIYRVYLRADHYPELYLGVMLPQDGAFFLKKTCAMRKTSILQATEADHLRGEIIRSVPGEKRALPLPFAFSELRLEHSFSFIEDPVLRNCLESQSGVMYTIYERIYYFVFPLDVHQPSAMAPFYCITTPVVVGTGLYGAFQMDMQGKVSQIIPATCANTKP